MRQVGIATVSTRDQRRLTDFALAGIHDICGVIWDCHLPISSATIYRFMRAKTYRGHRVELESEPTGSGAWVAKATIIIFEGKKEKRIPIFGRRRATFDSQRQADAYALELAKLWINGRTWGTNGHG